jgi:hypothetical protein
MGNTGLDGQQSPFSKFSCLTISTHYRERRKWLDLCKKSLSPIKHLQLNRDVHKHRYRITEKKSAERNGNFGKHVVFHSDKSGRRWEKDRNGWQNNIYYS